jgi:hypothetical protein
VLSPPWVVVKLLLSWDAGRFVAARCGSSDGGCFDGAHAGCLLCDPAVECERVHSGAFLTAGVVEVPPASFVAALGAFAREVFERFGYPFDLVGFKASGSALRPTDRVMAGRLSTLAEVDVPDRDVLVTHACLPFRRHGYGIAA